MNVSRRCKDGTVQETEVLNQSQIYITTAGYKNSFSYEKLIQLLIRMVVDPEKAFIMGGTWRIPVLLGLQSETFIDDLKNDSTFNEASFGREYESVWTGSIQDAFFDGEKFDRNRILQKPEYAASGRTSADGYYIISIDVGRKGCQTSVCIFKITPHAQGRSIKSLVNMYTFNEEHFETQAIKTKNLFYKYKAKRLVIDGNGLGIGFIDYMIKPQITQDGEVLPDFGVYNDDENFYKKYQTPNCEKDAIYIIKANAPINTEAHSVTRSEIEGGTVKFLIDEKTAQSKLMTTKLGKSMTPEKRKEYLHPYVLTSILREEMLNLREDNEGVNIILKRASKRLEKDKFSSFEYGLYYIKQEEERLKKKRNRFNAKDWCFLN